MQGGGGGGTFTGVRAKMHDVECGEKVNISLNCEDEGFFCSTLCRPQCVVGVVMWGWQWICNGMHAVFTS